MKKLYLLILLSPMTCLLAQQQYSLADCYRIALEKNTNVLMAKNKVHATVIDYKSAQHQLLPSFSYGMQHYFSSGKNIDPVTNSFVNETFSGGAVSLGFQYKIFSGFSAINAIKQSKLIIDAAAFGEKKVQLDVLQQITLVYARLLLHQEQAVMVRNNIATTGKELQIINEKIKLGMVTKYEFYNLDARRNNEQADLINIQNDSLTALQELKHLLDIPHQEQIGIKLIDTTMLSTIIAATIDPTLLIDQMLQRHPAVQQTRKEEQAARMNLKMAKSGFYPTLSIRANLASNYTTKGGNINAQKPDLPNQLNNNFGQNISISLQMPIFSQMQLANRVKKEKINISNAKFAIKEAENSVTSNTLQLINDFNAAKQKYKATAAAWQQSQISYRIYEEKYKLGLVSSLELITAKDFLVSSASKYLQAKFELFFRYQLLELLKSFSNDIKAS